MTTEGQPLIACTLLGRDLRNRLDWIATLMHDALRDSQRDDLTLRLRFAPEAGGRVREMMRKEQACCGFLTFEMDECLDKVWLTIKAPEAARAAADTLFAQFSAQAGPLP